MRRSVSIALEGIGSYDSRVISTLGFALFPPEIIQEIVRLNRRILKVNATLRLNQLR